MFHLCFYNALMKFWYILVQRPYLVSDLMRSPASFSSCDRMADLVLIVWYLRTYIRVPIIVATFYPSAQVTYSGSKLYLYYCSVFLIFKLQHRFCLPFSSDTCWSPSPPPKKIHGSDVRVRRHSIPVRRTPSSSCCSHDKPHVWTWPAFLQFAATSDATPRGPYGLCRWRPWISGLAISCSWIFEDDIFRNANSRLGYSLSKPSMVWIGHSRIPMFFFTQLSLAMVCLSRSTNAFARFKVFTQHTSMLHIDWVAHIGRNYKEQSAWRGNIVIAKYRESPFSSMTDATMADFPILKNYLMTHGLPPVSL